MNSLHLATLQLTFSPAIDLLVLCGFACCIVFRGAWGWSDSCPTQFCQNTILDSESWMFLWHKSFKSTRYLKALCQPLFSFRWGHSLAWEWSHWNWRRGWWQRKMEMPCQTTKGWSFHHHLDVRGRPPGTERDCSSIIVIFCPVFLSSRWAKTKIGQHIHVVWNQWMALAFSCRNQCLCSSVFSIYPEVPQNSIGLIPKKMYIGLLHKLELRAQS